MATVYTPLSMREKVLEAMVAALNSDRPAEMPAATRRRFRAIEGAALPHLDMAPGSEEVERGTRPMGPVVRRRLRVKLRVWTAGEAPEIAADPICWYVVSRLAGQRLGGLVHDIEELSTEWQGQVANSEFGLTEIELLVTYQTKTTDQEAIS